MVRLYLLAEGLTEQTFASVVLRPQLDRFGVVLQGPMRIDSTKKKGRVSRGGGRNYQALKKQIRRLLKQERGAGVFFTTMIDLYAIAPKFPGLGEAENLRHIPEKRVEALELAFAEDIGDHRFIPYIQLHEFEAYLFSDPTCFELIYNHHEREIEELKTIAASKSNPELIDDGQHSAPSKRITSVFPEYQSAKGVMGPQIAELIGLPTIRAKCPHFNAWLTRLEGLGREPAELPSR